MELSKEQHFQKIYDALDDVHFLASPKVYSIINRLFFYLNCLEKDTFNTPNSSEHQIAQSLENSKDYSILKSLILEKVFLEMNLFYSRKNKFKHYELTNSSEGMSMKTMLSLQQNLSIFHNVIDVFKFHGKVLVTITKTKILVRGEILHDNSLELGKKKIIALTKKLLQNSAILTCSVLSNGRKGLSDVQIELNLSHSDVFSYEFYFKKLGLSLGVSNTFLNYRLDQDMKTLKFGCDDFHEVVIEIDEFANVQSRNLSQSFVLDDFTSKEAFRFQFFFRTLIIVFPSKGDLKLDSNKFFDYDKSHTLNNCYKFDVFKILGD